MVTPRPEKPGGEKPGRVVAPAPATTGGVTGLVYRVLGYMDTPWKAVTVVVLVVLCGVGYGGWVERERLFFAKPSGADSLAVDKVSGELVELLRQTGADWGSVWSVSLGTNAQQLIQARQKDGGSWAFSPKSLPVILGDTKSQLIVGVLHGGACVDGAGLPSLLVRRLVADGMRRFCAVAVRGPARVVGVIYLAWRWTPDATEETTYLADARDTAVHLLSTGPQR
jgi:hypothetical protein